MRDVRESVFIDAAAPAGWALQTATSQHCERRVDEMVAYLEMP